MLEGCCARGSSLAAASLAASLAAAFLEEVAFPAGNQAAFLAAAFLKEVAFPAGKQVASLAAAFLEEVAFPAAASLLGRRAKTYRSSSYRVEVPMVRVKLGLASQKGYVAVHASNNGRRPGLFVRREGADQNGARSSWPPVV